MTKYAKLIERMTVEQKATLLTAAKGWNKISAGDTAVSAFSPSEGKRGLKVARSLQSYGAPTTAFPSPENIARSFDTQLAASVSDTVAKEAVALGVNAIETPVGAVIAERTEAGDFSEDAYLSGKMLAAYVRGYEHGGVMAVMPICDENYKTWLYREDKIQREAGLEPYEIAVKEGAPSMVRIADGTLEGVPMSESRRLIEGILGTEWQYKGAVSAFDGGTVNIARALSLGVCHLPSAASSAEAKRLVLAVEAYKQILVDIEAGNSSQAKLASALASGDAVSEESVDEALEKLLCAVDAHAVSADGGADKYSSYPFNHKVVFDEHSHAELAFRAACDTVVLLKNEDNVLPISYEKKVALIGDYAFVSLAGVADEGMVPLDTESANDISSRSGLKIIGSARGFSRTAIGVDSSALIGEAVELAADADIAVVFMGDLSDRSGATLKAQIELIKKLRTDTQAKLVAVYFGDAADMSWNDECDAVLLAGDPGQGGARAIYAILNGSVNPSAKLAVGICDGEVERNLREGLYGYRATQAFNVAERYPFGFGLSYTSFEYSDMSVTEKGVSFTLKNVGSVAGAEIVQLYVGRENSRVSAVRKELRGFTKVFLAAGESKRVTVPFDSRAFRYYNTLTHSFETEGGFYQIFIASSSRNLELIDELEIPSSGAALPTDEPVDTQTPKRKPALSTSKLIQTVAAGALALCALLFAVLYFATLREELSFVFGFSNDIILDLSVGVVWLGAMVGAVAWLIASLGGIRLPEELLAATDSALWYHKPDRLYPDDRDTLVFSGKENVLSSDGGAREDGVSTSADALSVTATARKRVFARHSAAKAREAGVAALYGALRNYESANGVYVADDELRELFAAFSASRNIVVRSSDREATMSALKAFAECFCADVHRIETRENDKCIADAYRELIAAVDNATHNEEKLSIAVIDGDASITDMSEYMGQLINYTGSSTERFVLTLGQRELALPRNMWFVCIVPDDACIETYGACVIRMRAQLIESDINGQGSGEMALDVYELTCDTFAETVNSDMETYYLSETYWKKVDKLVEYVSARVPFKISNKTANAMERFITVCIGGGAEQTEALDCVISSMLLCRLSSQSAESFDGDETLSEFMDSIFGADKDDRSRETVKLKGIK